MKKVGVAILGLGVVGGGTYRILTENKQYFMDTQGVDVAVEAVLEPRKERALAMGVPEDAICSHISEVVGNPAVDVVVECIGGEEPAFSFLMTALQNGKTCVTSNKELFSKHWHELETRAKENNANIFFEATCMGGVPVIRVLADGMQANRVQKICGIVNGTTNYILTRMDQGLTFESALKEAQEKGYAEANPKADVEGYDAMYKLSILSGLAFHYAVPLDKISRKGITEIEKKDVDYAKALGYAVKLLAVGKRTDAGLEVRVQPAMVSLTHPIANIKDCFNAIVIVGDSVGEIMLTGRGAGAEPTGSAIVSDVIFAAKHLDRNYTHFLNDTKDKLKLSQEVTAGHYLRFNRVDDSSAQAVVAALGKSGVTAKTIRQEGEDILAVTAESNESAVLKAVERAAKNGVSLAAMYRVEEL